MIKYLKNLFKPQEVPPPKCEWEEVKFNSPSQLPPVGCWLMLDTPNMGVIRAKRTGYIENKNREMEYMSESGIFFYGRFAWTYP